MKKFFYIAALLLSTGAISSCTKENDAKPTINKVAGEMVNTEPIGNGDGGVDRPKK